MASARIRDRLRPRPVFEFHLITLRVDPNDGFMPVERVDPLVAALGADVGVRTAILPKTELTLSLWTLTLDSELLFVGDAGITERSRSSERRGLEIPGPG